MINGYFLRQYNGHLALFDCDVDDVVLLHIPPEEALVRCQQLRDPAEALASVFEPEMTGENRRDQALDRLRERYGEVHLEYRLLQMVAPPAATSLPSGAPPVLQMAARCSLPLLKGDDLQALQETLYRWMSARVSSGELLLGQNEECVFFLSLLMRVSALCREINGDRLYHLLPVQVVVS
jgi:hypothetical protein